MTKINPELKSWYVHKHKVRTDYPVIENLQQFIADEPPLVHPEHPRYVDFWSRETKKCIEGIWGKEFGKYRYMPGNLYYFGNYGVIEHTWEQDGVKITEDIKPFVVDFIWEYAAQSWACYGFSGFDKDTEISCNRKLIDFKEGRLTLDELPKSCLKPDGTPKEYEPAFSYLLKLHNKKLGKSLFENPTINYMNFGTRGSSKSYYSAIAEVEYNFVFGGARRFDQKFIDKEYKASQCVGSSETDKSSEMLNKFEYSLNAKANAENKKFAKWFGIWTDYDSEGNSIITPCPFYKRHLGNLNCPNKKNLFRARYQVMINGEWQEKGDGSTVAHVNYSEKKGNGDRAAEGGRYLFSDVEEVGSSANFIGILGANEGTISRGGMRFGVQAAQGTSGNIEYVQAAKKVFTNPSSYMMLEHKTVFSSTPTGYYVPYYVTLFQYKDKNGNTDYDKAIAEVNRQRAEIESDDPKTIRDFIMNKPCYIEEMWLTNKGYYLPYDECAARERSLLKDNEYLRLEHCVKLYYDSEKPRGVWYDMLHDAEPYRSFPHDPAKMKNPEGCVVIYDFPQEIHGEIPSDMYMFIGHDPHGDGKDPGSSVASTYVLMNPKYAGSPYNLKGNTIVASYNGKPKGGLDEYYEIQERLLAFYGNPVMGLMYEKNKGEACRAHYIKKHKIHLLSPTPQFGQGSAMNYKQIRDFGYFTGSSLFGKANMAKYIHDWLLEYTELQDGKKQNWERLPCIYLVRQMMQYDLEGNFDAVDGFRGCILGLREYQIKQQSDTKKKTEKSTTYQKILNNPRIFQQRRNGI